MAKLRVAVLVVLAALTLGYRVTAVYTRYFDPDLAARSQYSAHLERDAMVVYEVEPALAKLGEGPNAQLIPQKGDRIVEVYDVRGNGGRINSVFDYGAYLKPIQINETSTLVVERPRKDGTFEKLTIAMPPCPPLNWSWSEWIQNLSFDLVIPLISIATGLFVGFSRPRDGQAFLAALVFIGYMVAFRQPVNQFPPGWREMALVLSVTAWAFTPYLILRFFLRFPRPSPLDVKAPWLNPAFFAISTIMWLVSMVFSCARDMSFAAYTALHDAVVSIGLGDQRLDKVFGYTMVVMVSLAMISLLLNTVRAQGQDDRRRMRIIATGALVGLTPLGVLFAIATMGKKTPVALTLTIALLSVLFPLSFAYAVVKHRVFGIRLILRRGLQYALVSRGFLVVEALAIVTGLYFAAGPLFERVLPDSPQTLAYIGAGLAVALAAGIRTVNRRVLPLIDRRFFRDAYNTQKILAELAHSVRQLATRPDLLLSRVTDEIAKALHPREISVFLVRGRWPHIRPLERPEIVSWESDDGEQKTKYFLYGHWRTNVSVLAESGARAALGEPILSGRVALSAALASAVQREPETLEVFPVDRRVQSAEPADATSGVPAERALYERFGARLVVPLVTNRKTVGFMMLGEKLSEEPYSREDKDLLLRVAEQTATALDYSGMIVQAAEQERIQRELQIAQDVQARLLPHDRPPMQTLRYAGACRAALGVGGDYFDFIKISESQLGVAVGDISGKGISAALLMASLHALLRSHATSHVNDLEGLARELNEHLFESTDEARFATLFFAVYDDRSRLLRCLNAGHVPPLVLRAPRDGRARDVQRLHAGGTVLGMFPEERFEIEQVELQPGDLLLVYSDGVTEAANVHGDLFGENRLIDALRRNADLAEEQIVARVLAEVDEFMSGVAQQDDITLIAARVA